MDLTPEQIASADAAYWAIFSKIKLQAGEFSFVNHEYQQEPLQSTARRRCCMKATQGGWTEIEVLRVLHGLIYGIYRRGVLYMFPTNDDVGDFSKSRFNPLIAANREAIGKYVKGGGTKGTDTTYLKKVCDAFLYLRGARLTQSTGIGEKESSRMRSIPADVCVFDELDLMDMDVVAKALGRMHASDKQHEVYISNPTLPEYGIDSIFQKSDQRYLHIKCPHCNEYTCAALEFPECVKLRENGTGYIECKKCGRELVNRTIGEWVPSERDNTDYMEGWHWSQLNSAMNDPAEILRDFNDPPQGNIGDVYRLRLGFPYVATEDRLTASTVLGRCDRNAMPTSHVGQCAMGVDIGKTKHIVIGIRTGNDTYQLVKVIRVSKWTDIHDLARKYNVKSAVIDIRPYEDEARSFQKAEKGQMRTFLCEYSENTTLGTIYNDHTGIVKVNRTEICDHSHRVISEEKLTIPRRCDEINEFAKQMSNMAKVLETNKKTGTQIYRYRKVGSGGDHYRHALNYFLLAASGGKIARAGRREHRQKFTKNVVTI